MMYTAKEVEILGKFRYQVKDIIENPEDHFLIRWLRARNLDIKKAEEMLKNYLEWRKNNKDFKHVIDYHAPKPVTDSLRYKFTGFDYDGRPVLWVPIGRWEVRRLFSEGFKAECFKLQYRVLEEITGLIERQRKLCGQTQFVVIADSAELSFWKVAHYETVEAILKFFKEFEAYYPELLHSCYIVNNPMVFSYIFNLVKPLLSTHTLSKVQMFDYNEAKWSSALLSALPPEVVPIEYGGTGEGVL